MTRLLHEHTSVVGVLFDMISTELNIRLVADVKSVGLSPIPTGLRERG